MHASPWGPVECLPSSAHCAPGGTRSAVLTGPLLSEDISEHQNHKLMVLGWQVLWPVGPEVTMG